MTDWYGICNSFNKQYHVFALFLAKNAMTFTVCTWCTFPGIILLFPIEYNRHDLILYNHYQGLRYVSILKFPIVSE